MMFTSAIAVAILFSQAAAAPAAPKQAETVAVENPQDKMICRKEVPIGSLIAKRKCRTAREWRAMTEATRTELQQGRNSGGTNGN